MDLIDRQAAIDALEKVAELYPWRVPGDRDSYSSYNEAWQDALNRAENEIEALPSVQPGPEEFEWCHDCKEYDQNSHCFHRWTKVIRQTVEELREGQTEAHWIPCSERLPEKDMRFYLATIANHGLNFTTTLPDDVDVIRWDYDRRKGHDSWHWCTERTVVAWMPLPAPYQKEGGKQ